MKKSFGSIAAFHVSVRTDFVLSCLLAEIVLHLSHDFALCSKGFCRQRGACCPASGLPPRHITHQVRWRRGNLCNPLLLIRYILLLQMLIRCVVHHEIFFFFPNTMNRSSCFAWKIQCLEVLVSLCVFVCVCGYMLICTRGQ